MQNKIDCSSVVYQSLKRLLNKTRRRLMYIHFKYRNINSANVITSDTLLWNDSFR